jgi:peptide/nickel transport system permease protein
MRPYIIRRLLLLIVVVWGVGSLTFTVTMMTGDPVTLMAGPEQSRQQIEEMRHQLGLDRPLYEQYARYMLNAVRGDFGMSFRHREPAFTLVLERMPYTIALAGAAILLSVAFALPIGIIAAMQRGTIYDGLVMLGALIGQAVPSFWLAIVLILVFGVGLRWLPVGGSGDPSYLVLPAVTVAGYPLARNARLVRSALLEVLGKEYVVTARAKGLTPRVVLIRHALRNALIPIVTLIALDVGALLGGAVIVETVFGWPGIGRLTIQAIQQRDFPVIQAGVTMVATIFVLVNLAVDVLYTYLDPRIRYR